MSPDRSAIYIFYEHTDVIVKEESLVHDAGSIVAAVGGSMGLFLGFSCLQCANSLLERLVRAMHAKLRKDTFLPHN